MKEAALTVAASEPLLCNGGASLSEGCGKGRDVGIKKVVDGCRDVLFVIGIASDSANLLNDYAPETNWGGQHKSIQCRKINAFAGHLGHG